MKVIYSIFAGRRIYIDILTIYLDKLLELKYIDEVYMFNFCRDLNDEIYIKNICDTKSKYKFITCSSKSYNEYYKYFNDNLNNFDDNDIIIKSDDDIVYIDIENFNKFINIIDSDNFYYPNIINNDVCASIQTINGVHNLIDVSYFNNKKDKIGEGDPLTNWYQSYECANNIHELFLENPQKFIINTPTRIMYGNRISINLFAGRVKFLKKIYENHSSIHDDERYISSDVCNKFNITNIIVPFFNVVHFSFGSQNTNCLITKYIDKYYLLAYNYINKTNFNLNEKYICVYCKKLNRYWIKNRTISNYIPDIDKNILINIGNNKFIEIFGDFYGNDIFSDNIYNLEDTKLLFNDYIYSKNILFIITRINHLNGKINGKNIRFGGVGCSGTEQSTIIIAEKLAQNGYICNIVSDNNNLEIVNNVIYTDFNLSNLKYKHFKYVISVSWIDDILFRIPFTNVNNLILVAHCQSIDHKDVINRFLQTITNKRLNIIYPSVFSMDKILNNLDILGTKNITNKIIYNPLCSDIFNDTIFNVNDIYDHKIKHSMIFTASWERGGIMAEKIFNKLNWTDGRFDKFCYYNISNNISVNNNIYYNGSVDKNTIYNKLIKSEYFVYPLILNHSNSVHLDTFACVVSEALKTGVIVITLPLGALPEIYGDSIIFIDIPNEFYNEPIGLTGQISSRQKDILYGDDMVNRYVQKIIEIDNNIELKKSIIKRGLDKSKMFNSDLIYKEYISYFNNIDNNVYSHNFNLESYKRLMYIQNNDTIPNNHINYLLKLKKDGFNPKVIYDVGCATLQWYNVVKNIWPDSHIYCFDAIYEYEYLYKQRGIKYFIELLSDKDNLIRKFYYSLIHPNGSSYYKEIGTHESHLYFNEKYAPERKTMTLDTLVKLNNLELPDFVKIDVQGAEVDIINGSQETFINVKHLIVELQNTNYNENVLLSNQSIQIIEKLGFKCISPLFQNNGPDGDYGFQRIN